MLGGEIMNSKKKILSDSIWSVAGLVLMNVTLQFAVYPLWERKAGEATLGNILYLLSLMNVFSVSMGISVSYARLKNSTEGKTSNVPYIVILGGASILAFVAAIVISFIGGVSLSLLETVIFGIVMCVTMWRYYADVEYKLSLNYKSFFLYYLFISVGYGIGVALFYLTGLWPLTLLMGEIFGLAYVFLRGKIFRIDEGIAGSDVGDIIKLVLVLFSSEALSTLVFNADRIMLKTLIDEVAVTDYYLASLLGKTIALLTVPLGGVLVGYLSKYNGDFKLKGMNLITALSLIIVIFATLACTVGSYIIIPILYPDQFNDIKQYFMWTNLSQVLYFIANVITVILLRFANSRYQIYINAVYAVSFVGICIPFTVYRGFDGFCFGLVLTCTIRFLVSLLLGYYSTLKKRRVKEVNAGGENED